MGRRKVTFVYETGRPLHGPIAQMMPNLENHVRRLGGVDPSSVTVEDLPDPPIVQKFVVERVATPEQGRKTASHVYARLASYPDDGQITVTEVTDA